MTVAAAKLPEPAAVSAEVCRRLQFEFVHGFEAKLTARAELPLPGGDSLLIADLRRARRYADRILAARDAVAAAAEPDHDNGGQRGPTRRAPDRGLLDRIPVNPAASISFIRRGLLRETRLAVAAAATVCDLDSAARGKVEGPAGLGEALEALAALNLPADLPAVIGVFSPTGWTAEAIAHVPEEPRRRVALVQRRPDGSFQVFERDGRVTVLSELFDPEPAGRKASRCFAAVRAALEELPAGELLWPVELARKIEFPPRSVIEACEELARRDSRLVLKEVAGRLVMFRNLVISRPTSLVERLWPFSEKSPADAETLVDRRVRLSVLRDQAWRELEKLHQEEARLMTAGVKAEREGDRRRLATMLAGVRRESRHRLRIADMLEKQISVLAGHLHSLELIALGTMVALPTAEELAAAADAAQKTIESVQESWQAARAAEPDASVLEGAEENAILTEFERGKDAELAALEVKPAAVEPQRTVERPVEKPGMEAPAEPERAQERNRPERERRAEME
jgi:hypothetical protein